MTKRRVLSETQEKVGDRGEVEDPGAGESTASVCAGRDRARSAGEDDDPVRTVQPHRNSDDGRSDERRVHHLHPGTGQPVRGRGAHRPGAVRGPPRDELPGDPGSATTRSWRWSPGAAGRRDHTKDGTHHTEAGTHCSLIVYAECVDPCFWDDHVGHISAVRTYSCENGAACVVTESLTAVEAASATTSWTSRAAEVSARAGSGGPWPRCCRARCRT